jgi:hypothetical protein
VHGSSPVGDPLEPAEHFGAYGLALTGCGSASPWWNAAPAGWTPWEFRWAGSQSPDGAPGTLEQIEQGWARVRARPSGWVVIDRARRISTLYSDAAPSVASLVHPHVGSTAAVHAYWSGLDAFHAGCFVRAGRVWAVLGDRTAGKSSTLAWLLRDGGAVFADDMLVLSHGTALAGPRCLDLRHEAAERFTMGEDIGMVGTRRRWRVPLGAVPPELPFAGWVVLRWSASAKAAVSPAPVADRLRLLVMAQAVRASRPGAAWLDLLAAPMLIFERPRQWAPMDEAMQLLLTSVDGAA